MTEMKLYMAKCKAERDAKFKAQHEKNIAEYGYCTGPTYKEWTAGTRQKGVSMKGKNHSHTALWNHYHIKTK
jgi:hypothetical protein|tara:strand:+ start:29 stop:244 length:216 start_codon:yes stop_codon:yes gene_type:complete